MTNRFINLTIWLFTIITLKIEYLKAGGRNPRYYGNDIWTSEPKNHGLGFVIGPLIVMSIILIAILLYDNKQKIKDGTKSVIYGAFGLIIIGIVVLFEFFVKVLLMMMLGAGLPDRDIIPQWLGGLLAIAVCITIPRSFILRKLKNQI